MRKNGKWNRGAILAGRRLFWVFAVLVITAFVVSTCGGGKGPAPARVNLNKIPPHSGAPPATTEKPELGPIPNVLALDSMFPDASRSVSQGTQVMTFGADVLPGGTGTTSDKPYAIEVEGTTVNLRAYEPGEYSLCDAWSGHRR